MPSIRKVSGQKDPIMQLLRELQAEAGRERNRLFFVEGAELVRRAWEFGARAECVVLTDRFACETEGEHLLDQAAGSGTAAYSATAGLLGKILEAKPVPECLAIVERRVFSPGDLFSGKTGLVQLVEHGESADNLGMLLRTTDAAGVDGVVLAAGTVDPFCRRTVRGSRGAVLTVPICIAGAAAGVLKEAGKRGFRVIAASANAELDYMAADYRKPTVLVAGNEHTGISAEVRRLADAVVRIPMHGRIHSMNIAIASGILLYEALRQRRRPAGRVSGE